VRHIETASTLKVHAYRWMSLRRDRRAATTKFFSEMAAKPLTSGWKCVS